MFTCIIDPDLMSLKVCKYLIEMFFSLVLTELPALHCETLRGKGVPRVHIMEIELEDLGDRESHDGHLAEMFLKK